MYRVLIVEDELRVCRGLEVLVDWNALGFSVQAFIHDGLSAKQRLESERFDLILCDIRIPGIDGLELIHWMRDAGIQSRVIVISAYAEFDYAQRAIADRVDAYLLKPINQEKLEAALRTIKIELDYVKAEPKDQAAETIAVESSLVNAAIAKIKNNLSKHLTTETLAKMLYVSTAQLNQQFRKIYNISAKEYISRARMERAKHLLIHTDQMIYEITQEIGFHDVDYFTRIFKLETGCPPNAWRKRHRQSRQE